MGNITNLVKDKLQSRTYEYEAPPQVNQVEKAKTIAEKPVLGQGGILPQIFGRGAQIHIDVTNIDCKQLAKTPMDAMTVGQAVKTMELVNTGKTTMTRDELPFLRNATATLQCGPK